MKDCVTPAVRFSAPGHLLGGPADGYITLDREGGWRPRRNSGEPPDWNRPPLDSIFAFTGLCRNGRVSLGRLQADRPSEERGIIPPVRYQVEQYFNRIVFNLTDPDFLKEGMFEAGSWILPFDYDLSALSGMILRFRAFPDKDMPFDEWAGGMVLTPDLFGNRTGEVSWQCIRLQARSESVQRAASHLEDQPNALLAVWRDDSGNRLRLRQLVVFFPETERAAIRPVFQYCPGDPSRFFHQALASPSLLKVSEDPECFPEKQPGESPCWIVMGVVSGQPDGPVSVPLMVAWRTIDAENLKSAEADLGEAFSWLNPIVGGGVMAYLQKEHDRLDLFVRDARPEGICGALAESFMTLPARVTLRADDVLRPPSGTAFSLPELFQWHLLFPRWARNTLITDMERVRHKPPLPEAVSWVLRVALDGICGLSPNTSRLFRILKAWDIPGMLEREAVGPELQRAVALWALSSVAARVGLETAASELSGTARAVAESWERQVLPELLAQGDGLSFKNRGLAEAVHFLAMCRFFWYDELIDWKSVEVLLRRISAQCIHHPEWVMRMALLSLSDPENGLGAWLDMVRRLFERQHGLEEGGGYDALKAWSWLLAVVGAGFWPDLGLGRLNLSVPARACGSDPARWKAWTPLGVCDVAASAANGATRVEVNVPVPLEVESIMIRLPEALASRGPELWLDDESVSRHLSNVLPGYRRMVLKFSKRLRFGGRLVLTL